MKQEEIEQLETEWGAVVLAHHYVDPQVQGVADYIGDSFYLSRVAAGFDRRIMVLCGVSFMGESGKPPSPDEVILMPDVRADCPMTHMVTRGGMEQYRREYPDPAVACYVDSIAEVKSWSDVCVTSVNAVQTIRSLPDRDILFIPDKNLGQYMANQVPGKHVMSVNGCCPVHDQMLPKEVSALKEIHPDAQVLAHSECDAQVLKLADYIGSTIGILRSAADGTSREFVICTEDNVRYELERQSLGRYFHFPDTEPVCRDMKRVTLDKIIHILHAGQGQAPVPKAHVPSAGRVLEQMLNLVRQPPESRFQAVDFRQSIS